METGHSASEEEARIAAVSSNGRQTVCKLQPYDTGEPAAHMRVEKVTEISV